MPSASAVATATLCASNESVSSAKASRPAGGPSPTGGLIADSVCEVCGAQAPTQFVEIHRVIGAIVLRFRRSIEGQLCRPCIVKYVHEFTLATLLGGWWSITSLVLTPFFVGGNLLTYFRTRSLGLVDGPQPIIAPGTPVLAPPAGRSPYARLSLILGLAGIPTLGFLGVGSVVGAVLGVAGLTSREEHRKALALAGLGANLIALVSAPFLLVFGLSALSKSTSPAHPGRDAFRAADGRIVAFEGNQAFGNTPEATALARRLSDSLGVLGKITSAGEGAAPPLSLTQGRFLTYCEVRDDRICFLVHVPGLRHYPEASRKDLLGVSWKLAQGLTKDLRQESDRKLAVGLRGVLTYGAVATGMGQGGPHLRVGDFLEPSLYEFFASSLPGSASLPLSAPASSEPSPVRSDRASPQPAAP